MNFEENVVLAKAATSINDAMNLIGENNNLAKAHLEDAKSYMDRADEAHCPKCGCEEISTVGWAIETRKESYSGNDCEEGKFLDVVHSGTDPAAETSCAMCFHRGTAKEFGLPCQTIEDFVIDDCFPKPVSLKLRSIIAEHDELQAIISEHGEQLRKRKENG